MPNLLKQKSPAYSPTWCRFTNFVHKKRQNKNNKIEKKKIKEITIIKKNKNE